jgi:hypothetical protein
MFSEKTFSEIGQPMKSIFSRVLGFINEPKLPATEVLSAKSIRILLWTRVVLKIYLILLGLYLIVNFARFIKFLIMN